MGITPIRNRLAQRTHRGARKIYSSSTDLRMSRARGAKAFAQRGQSDLPRAPFDERRAQDFLQLLHLKRQRGLGDRAGLGRAAEMTVLGQRLEIAKMLTVI